MPFGRRVPRADRTRLPRLGLHIDTGYMIARPRVTVKSTLGEDTRVVRADMLSVRVGLAYSVF